MTNPSQRINLTLSDESLDELIERAASIVIERLPKPEPPSRYVTTAEAAAFLRAKPQRVHDLLSAGKLTRFKEGGRTLILRAELEALVEQGRR